MPKLKNKNEPEKEFLKGNSMGNQISRRSLIGAGVAAIACVPGFALGNGKQQQATLNTDRQLPGDLVLKFVRGAHTDLALTQELLADEPRLLRANWEWSPGDFESAIDAAAHTGSIEIVGFLLEHGAPYSVFTAAVLGDLTTLEAAFERNRDIIKAQGPHGITLHEHAVAGGDEATAVREFLEAQGAPQGKPPLDLEVDKQLAARVVGSYLIETEQRKLGFQIELKEDRNEKQRHLWLTAAGRASLRLQYQGQDRFVLEGTPAELLFQQDYESALLREGRPIGIARRVEAPCS